MYTSLILGCMKSFEKYLKTRSDCSCHLQKKAARKFVWKNLRPGIRPCNGTYFTCSGIIFNFSLITPFMKLGRSTEVEKAWELRYDEYIFVIGI